MLGTRRQSIWQYLRHMPLWRWVAIVGSAAIFMRLLATFYSSKELQYTQSQSIAVSEYKCESKPNHPALYIMQTSLGVNYDAGHWFHVAENFMAQHTKLRAEKRQSNSNEVYYCFDKGGFVKDFNGFTKLLILLGTTTDTSSDGTFTAHFMDCADTTVLDGWKTLPIGTTMSIKVHDSTDVITDFLDVHIPPAQRFVSGSSSTSRLSLASNNSVGGSDIQARSSSNSLRSDLPHSAEAIGHLGNALRNDRPVDGVKSQRNGTATRRLFTINQPKCVQYQGTVGGYWPALDRGHWYPNDGDITSFRNKISKYCPLSPDQDLQFAKRKKYKMVLYQRDLNRKLLEQESALNLLSSAFPSDEWELVVIMHDSKRSPCLLAAMIHNVDVLITPHGFQSMLLMFMPLPSVLFEIFPYKYFKTGYARFAFEYGVTHTSVMSPPTSWHTRLFLALVSTKTCMDYKQCRGYARGADVRLTNNGVLRLKEVVAQYIAKLPTTKQHRLYEPSK